MKNYSVIISSLMLSYLISYILLSLNGIYRPAVVGLNGIKWYYWAPYGYYDSNIKPRKFIAIFYSPLNYLDNRFVHNDEHALHGPSDNSVNFDGKVIQL